MIRLLRYVANLVDTPQSRGTFGEMIVASIFDPRFFGEEEHYIVNDLLFETSDGKTHQIDHVVIYKNGIFCIETKNIDGLILGHPNIDKWKVYIKPNFEPYEIYNPIFQNSGHVSVLSKYLMRTDIHSLIVFVKGNKPKDCGDSVIDIQDLKDYIKNYPCEIEMGSEEMKMVYSLLTSQKETTEVTKAEHIKNVSNIKKDHH